MREKSYEYACERDKTCRETTTEDNTNNVSLVYLLIFEIPRVHIQGRRIIIYLLYYSLASLIYYLLRSLLSSAHLVW